MKGNNSTGKTRIPSNRRLNIGQESIATKEQMLENISDSQKSDLLKRAMSRIPSKKEASGK
jgi:hypothetical protein